VNTFDDALDADGQVALGCQAFVRGQHPTRMVFQQNAVGVGAAGIYAQHQSVTGIMMGH
jgi:hypothetical protein